MISATEIIARLTHIIRYKTKFRKKLVYSPENKTLEEYRILKYKTSSDIFSSIKIQGAIEQLVSKYAIHIVLDGKWKKRELEHFDITNLSDDTKKLCHKFFASIEESLPYNLTHYKDCYLVVLSKDILAVEELFKEMEYPIEEIEMKDFKKFLEKPINHTDYYQAITLRT